MAIKTSLSSFSLLRARFCLLACLEVNCLGNVFYEFCSLLSSAARRRRDLRQEFCLAHARGLQGRQLAAHMQEVFFVRDERFVGRT